MKHYSLLDAEGGKRNENRKEDLIADESWKSGNRAIPVPEVPEQAICQLTGTLD
jgi:hypothetical protein